MTTTEPAPLVLADRWPAQLTSPAGITEPARCVLTVSADGAAGELWAWSPTGVSPTLLVRSRWDPQGSQVPADGGGTWTVVTDAGTYTVRGGVGCGGCGSVMQTWQPWSPWRYAARWPEGMA